MAPGSRQRNSSIFLNIDLREIDALGHESAGVSSVADNVAYRAGRNVRELLRGRDYDGVDIGIEPAVRIGVALLGLEVHEVSYATDYVLDSQLFAGVGGEAFVVDYPHAAEPLGGLLDDVHFLLGRKETSLVLVDAYGHNHFVEHGERPLQDVQMAGGKGIEGSRK